MRKRLIGFVILTLVCLYYSTCSAYAGGKDSVRTVLEHTPGVGVRLENKLRKISLDQVNPNWGLSDVWDTVNLSPYPIYYPFFKDSLMSFQLDSSSFVFPCKDMRITSPFGPRTLFGRTIHKGIDFDLETGDTVYATSSGKVRISRMGSGYGNHIMISHTSDLAGIETLYGHLSERFVRVGDYVEQGQPIGLGGSTGQSTGSHLHFEIRLWGISVNPTWVVNPLTFTPNAETIYVREVWIDYSAEPDEEEE